MSLLLLLEFKTRRPGTAVQCMVIFQFHFIHVQLPLFSDCVLYCVNKLSILVICREVFYVSLRWSTW